MGASADSAKIHRQNRRYADDSSAAFDEIDTHLLALLQTDGRSTLSALGRQINLSAAAVAERIRRLESQGTITGYTATVSAARLGYRMSAFIRVNPHGGFTLKHPRTRELMQRDEVREVHHVIGEDCWIIKVAVADVTHLEELLESVSALGRTTTSVVMSSPVENKLLRPLSSRSDAANPQTGGTSIGSRAKR